MRLFLIALFAVLVTAVTAKACDEMCKDGEYYSDDAEMCMPKTVGS